MKIRNRTETRSHLPESHWCSLRILIKVADKPTCCFLFQRAISVWPVRSHINGRSRCTGTCARVQNAGPFFLLPATASLFGRSSTRCCTTRRIEWTDFAIDCNWLLSIKRLLMAAIVIFEIFFIKINLILLWHDYAVATLFFIYKRMKTDETPFINEIIFLLLFLFSYKFY